MKLIRNKTALFWSCSVFVALILLLSVHLYQLYVPKPPDEHTIVMARFDFKNDLLAEDAVKVKSWLYQQKGVSHVYINELTNIAVFTFYPVQVSADKLVLKMQQELQYKASRFMPDKKSLSQGCPVSPNSLTYKAFKLITSIF